MKHSTSRSRRRAARACAIATMTLCVAAGAAPASWAASKSTGHDMKSMFEQADRDGDGRLSRDEYGLLSPATAAPTTSEPGAPAPGAANPDGMPATEHQAAVIDRFEDRDRDGDGYVTSEELADRRAQD